MGEATAGVSRGRKIARLLLPPHLPCPHFSSVVILSLGTGPHGLEGHGYWVFRALGTLGGAGAQP